MANWTELAKNALAVQSACNLSGVVHSFSRDVTKVRENLREEGKESTEGVNEHPVCVLYAAEIAWLTSGTLYAADSYEKAYNWAKDQVK
jgi:hypothetical protein